MYLCEIHTENFIFKIKKIRIEEGNKDVKGEIVITKEKEDVGMQKKRYLLDFEISRSEDYREKLEFASQCCFFSRRSVHFKAPYG